MIDLPPSESESLSVAAAAAETITIPSRCMSGMARGGSRGAVVVDDGRERTNVEPADRASERPSEIDRCVQQCQQLKPSRQSRPQPPPPPTDRVGRPFARSSYHSGRCVCPSVRPPSEWSGNGKQNQLPPPLPPPPSRLGVIPTSATEGRRLWAGAARAVADALSIEHISFRPFCSFRRQTRLRRRRPWRRDPPTYLNASGLERPPAPASLVGWPLTFRDGFCDLRGKRGQQRARSFLYSQVGLGVNSYRTTEKQEARVIHMIGEGRCSFPLSS